LAGIQEDVGRPDEARGPIHKAALQLVITALMRRRPSDNDRPYCVEIACGLRAGSWRVCELAQDRRFSKELINPDSIRVIFRLNQPTSPGQFQKRDAFLNRPARDTEEVLSVTYSEAAITLGDVGRYRERRAVQLIDEEVEAAREGLRELTDTVGKVHRLLIDEKFLEGKGHFAVLGNGRKG
jgi:hypothetical protein